VTPDAQTTIDRIATVLREHAGIGLAVLFGSFAAGRSRADSDIDVGIWPERELTDSQELRLQSALTLAAGREVDLVRLDRASTLLRWEVANKGRPLFEGNVQAFARFRALAAGEYLDFAPAFLAAGEVFRRRLASAGGPP